MIKVNRKASWYPWICWVIAASVYLVQYGLLVFPASIVPQLTTSLSLNPVTIGFFFSAFLYTYVLMQIPAGFAFDRYDATKLLFLSAFIMAVGCIILIFAHNLTLGLISRLLMGFGGSFAFVGAVYLGRNWFSAALFPMIVGLTEAMSGVGAIGFNTIFGVLQGMQNWRVVLAEITFFVLVLCVLIYIYVRERTPKKQGTASKKRLIKSTRIIFRKLNVWLIALYTGFGFVHFMVLTNMWEVVFLRQQYRINIVYAVLENGLVMTGFTLGGPLCGFLTRYFNYLKIMMTGALLQVILLMAIHYFNLGIGPEGVLLFALGIATGSIILSFEAIRREVPQTVYGISAGMINMFFGGLAIPVSPLVGYLLGISSKNMQVAVFPVILCSILSVLFCFVLILRKKGK